ncbi:hypothetical protein C3K47_18720 [Solitalea longa]|uniref:Spore coat protein CotH n=1 Tax=Solitalea longa TaxID=2079460 RepID=A0A2S4ZWM5_9SPHI|nr:CotH kinase family protein [Solitalea longa]POY34768.1 hypothetical protein C3K47_18720 [Solitalea longa]
MNCLVKKYKAITPLLLLLLITVCNSCKKNDDEPEVAVKFNKFSLSSSQNSPYLYTSIEFEIKDSVLTGRVPYLTTVSSLVPTFETGATSVTVNNVVQKSGVNALDFSKPVRYKLTDAKGKSSEFVIKLVNFTGLPIVNITTEGGAAITSKEEYLNGHVTINGLGGFSDFDGDLKIKGRGNSTWWLPKKPYKIKFDKKQSLLGMPQDKEWVLLANYTDKSQLRNATGLLMGQMSGLEWTPKAQYVEVYLNNTYQGSYQLCEAIKVAPSRVNVTDNGYLLEIDQLDRLDPGDAYFYTSTLLVNIKEPVVQVDDERYTYIKNYVNEMERVLFSADFANPQTGYAKYIDVPSFIDWYLINEIAKNQDANFFSSCYMNMVPNGKLKMGPIWDFDIGFGNVNYDNNHEVEGFWVQRASWMNRLFQDPAFVKQVKQRFLYFKDHKSQIIDNINSGAVKLKWTATENDKIWNTLYNYTWPNYAVYGSYDNEVGELKRWINARMVWLDGAFAKM